MAVVLAAEGDCPGRGLDLDFAHPGDTIDRQYAIDPGGESGVVDVLIRRVGIV